MLNLLFLAVAFIILGVIAKKLEKIFGDSHREKITYQNDVLYHLEKLSSTVECDQHIDPFEFKLQELDRINDTLINKNKDQIAVETLIQQTFK